MVMEWVVIAVCTTPLYVLLGWAMFGGWGGFLQGIRDLLEPDWFAMLRGDFDDEETWPAIKVMLFLALCVGFTFAVRFVAQAYIL